MSSSSLAVALSAYRRHSAISPAPTITALFARTGWRSGETPKATKVAKAAAAINVTPISVRDPVRVKDGKLHSLPLPDRQHPSVRAACAPSSRRLIFVGLEYA